MTTPTTAASRRPNVLNALDLQQLELLRLLGRLELIAPPQISSMVVLPAVSRAAMERQLRRLQEEGLIWCSPSDNHANTL